MTRRIDLGFSYVPGSIRVRFANADIPVTEVDPAKGEIEIDVGDDDEGEVSIAYQRRLLQGGQPRPDRVIGKADACIYCGSTEALQDEHIIPFGLEGEYVLADASCPTCAAITSRFERAILRHALLSTRTRLNLRTRRPHDRPERLRVVQERDGRRSESDVPVAEHPTHLALPVFDLPAFLRGDVAPNLRSVPPHVWIVPVGSVTMQEASAHAGGDYFGIREEIDVYAFARLLAKIAHGFLAAADLGDVEVFLPSGILGAGEGIGRWVGGAPDRTLPDIGLHHVAINLVDGTVQVRIKLFAQLGGPEYLVVAGRLINPSPE
jgi:hypothetical protein